MNPIALLGYRSGAKFSQTEELGFTSSVKQNLGDDIGELDTCLDTAIFCG